MLADDHSDVIQVEYSLRILECTHCGKTHRELPNELVPYKRYSLSLICEEVEDQNYTCDTSTMLRLKLWLNWFICYAQAILNKLALESVYLRTDLTGKSLANKLAYFVRVVVNSGFWITASFGHD